MLRHLARTLALAAVAGLLATSPVLGSVAPAVPAATTSAGTSAPALSTAKVVIVVGATGSVTSQYRADADSAYATAIQYSSNVVKVYSPNATWSNVVAALQGANVVIYLGHGNGWPAPYPWDPTYATRDGFGLNATAGAGDSNLKYYGEPYLASSVRLAPNAVVLLNHLCYAAGSSEPGQPDPTLSVAMQRADNYGQGFIKAGARAVIAESWGSINGMIADLFTQHESILDLWRTQPDYNNNEFSFQSARNGAYSVFMDPDTPGGGYHRSLVGNPAITTDQITGVPYTPTDTTPATLQDPGAATVAAGGTTLYADSTLGSAVATVAANTAVRIDALASGGSSSGTSGAAAALQPVADVHTMDGSKSGWAAASALAPQDSTGPALWGIDGPSTITPNGDGVDDTMDLAVRFSEPVTWSAKLANGGAQTVWSATGTGDTAALAWDAKVAGATAPDGTYTLTIQAADMWGNQPLSTSLPLIVDTSPPTRLAGVDRYATAAAISAATFPAGVAVAYLATGANFPDALAGAAAAGFQHAPILLVTPSAIPPATATELTRLKPGRIVILGSTGAVSAGVATAAGAFTTGAVSRLAGADRFGTAAAISAATYKPGVAVAYLATGLNFPDALAGAAAAGSKGAPILLVQPDTIPAATAAELARLKPGRIVILGSTGVVAAAVATAAQAYTAGTVTRLAGADRFATAAAISAATYPANAAVVYLATGANFPDALAGAAAAGSAGAPILLVSSDTIPAATAAELARLHPARIIILGSIGVVSEAVRVLAHAYVS